MESDVSANFQPAVHNISQGRTQARSLAKARAAYVQRGKDQSLLDEHAKTGPRPALSEERDLCLNP